MFYVDQLRGGLASQRGHAGTSSPDVDAVCPQLVGASLDTLKELIGDFYDALKDARMLACVRVQRLLDKTDPAPVNALLLRTVLDAAIAASLGPLGLVVSRAVSAALVRQGLDNGVELLARAAGDAVAKAGVGLGQAAVSAARGGADVDPVQVYLKGATSAVLEDSYRVQRNATLMLGRLGSGSASDLAALECALSSGAKDELGTATTCQVDALVDGWLAYLARSTYGTVRDHHDGGGTRDVLDAGAALEADGASAIGVVHIAADVTLRMSGGRPVVGVRQVRIPGATEAVRRNVAKRPTLGDVRAAKVVECRVAPGATLRIVRDDSAAGGSRVAYPHPDDVASWVNGPEQLLTALEVIGGLTTGQADRFGGAQAIMAEVSGARPSEVVR